MEYATKETIELVKRAADGDKAAFEKIYKEYNKLVTKTVRVHAPRYHHTGDLEQQAWIRIWRHLGNYDSRKASFATFVSMITRYLILDLLRGERKVKVVDLFAVDKRNEEVNTLEGTKSLHTPSTLDQLIAQEDKKGVPGILKELTPKELQVFELYYRENKLIHVAEAVGLPSATAKTVHRRGLIRLRSLLKKIRPD